MTPLLEQLVRALRVLPGVGPRSAQRMALHLLQRNRGGGRALAGALVAAMDGIGRCTNCRDFSESEQCERCTDPRRDDRLVCVVESPADVIALEQSGGFRGRYFVLHGHLSPIDGIGPEDLGCDVLAARLAALGTQEGAELIIATNATVEGEATAHYLAGLASENGLGCSRIAHGIPLGGELELVDTGTLARAMSARTRL